MLGRAEALTIDIIELSGDRLSLNLPDDPRQAYAEAKATFAVVVAPPSERCLQPIAPSADWRVDLAEGCPAHCSYCYLAGSLKGPPITRVYANLEEILDGLPAYLGQGTITSRSAARAHEGTTYEASCYTDPLVLEPLTGSLSPAFARFEGGTAPVARRLEALRRMADAGYPVGLTIAPIIAAEGWQQAYGNLIDDAGAILVGPDTLDLTVELITHRYTAGSKAVLDSLYPGSALDMSGANRTTKRTKFGTEKQVYDAQTMRSLRDFFERRIAQALPAARILYWT